MRKACIELSDSMRSASLVAGDLGGGRCLYFFDMNDEPESDISAERWQKALGICLDKAEELKYEVSRIRGKHLISEEETKKVAMMFERVKNANK